MNGRQFGPYVIEVTNRQNTNTWLHMKLYEGKNNEIRRVMRKQSLRVNRLKRVAYGPYTLELIPNPNDLQEVSVTPELRKLMYNYYKGRAIEATESIAQEKNKKLITQNKKDERKAKKMLSNKSKDKAKNNSGMKRFSFDQNFQDDSTDVDEDYDAIREKLFRVNDQSNEGYGRQILQDIKDNKNI